MRPELAITHYCYAEALDQTGDAAGARAALDEATRLFTDMQMHWWAWKARSLGSRTGVAAPGEPTG